jgi:hypothetical protein
MFDIKITIILGFLMVIALVALPFVNRFYQKRADDFADNLLKAIPKEYNKQIKGNAYSYLIRYLILAILSGSIGLLDLQNSSGEVLFFKIINVFFCLFCLIFGAWMWKKEMKKLVIEKSL